MAKSIAKPRVAKKFNVAHLGEQPLFSTNPEAALPLLSMIGQAQLSIDDLLGQLSRQFIEHMLVLSAHRVLPASSTRVATQAKFAGTAVKVVLSVWANPRYKSNAPGYAPPTVKWRFLPMPR